MKEELAGIISEEEVVHQLTGGGSGGTGAGAGGSKEAGGESVSMEQLATLPANDVGARVDLENGQARDIGSSRAGAEGEDGAASGTSRPNAAALKRDLQAALNRIDENRLGLVGVSAGSPASETTNPDDSPSQQGTEKWVLDHVPPPIKVRREGEASEETTPQDLSPPSPKRMRELSRKGAIHDLPFSKVFSHPSI